MIFTMMLLFCEVSLHTTKEVLLAKRSKAANGINLKSSTNQFLFSAVTHIHPAGMQNQDNDVSLGPKWWVHPNHLPLTIYPQVAIETLYLLVGHPPANCICSFCFWLLGTWSLLLLHLARHEGAVCKMNTSHKNVKNVCWLDRFHYHFDVITVYCITLEVCVYLHVFPKKSVI